MRQILLVGLGSFAGGALRYLLTISFRQTFPYGTLTVNLLGCFLIGCLFSLAEKWQLSYDLRLLFITGFLGGFTTFSAFSAETMQLIRSGQIGAGIIYILASLLIGICLTFLGAWLFS